MAVMPYLWRSGTGFPRHSRRVPVSMPRSRSRWVHGSDGNEFSRATESQSWLLSNLGAQEGTVMVCDTERYGMQVPQQFSERD
jgi:hypothetical protein